MNRHCNSLGIGVGAPLVAKEEKVVMTTSSGFDVDFPCLDKKGNTKSAKKASVEEDDEDEEEFSLRPAYSRNGCFKVVGKLAQKWNPSP